MKLNNKDIKYFFHGDVSSFANVTMEIENDIFLPDGSYQPIVMSRTIRPQGRELIVDFKDEEDMSNFAMELLKPCVLDLDDGYEYECYLESKAESEEAFGAYTGTYTLHVIKHKPMVILQQDSFIVNGNYECGCIYEITSLETLAEFSIDGYTIHNLKANEPFIIDGIKKLIYYKNKPDISAFDDVDIWKFPKLQPGTHQIVKSNPDVQVTIKYYPVFF